MGVGILKRLWAVRPPGRSWAAMPVDTTQSKILPSDLSQSHSVIVLERLSCTPGTIEKKVGHLGVIAKGVKNACVCLAVIIQLRFLLYSHVLLIALGRSPVHVRSAG
jgi:hypothetical protein